MKLVKLVKEINRSKEDIIVYLNTLGIDKVSINTTLEADVVSKVYHHFKRDLEEQEKHVKKIVDFVKQNRVEISEATEVILKEEEEKKKKDEEKLVKKNIEDQQKKTEEERKKQELIAFMEREQKVKEAEEEAKRRKAELERLFESQKKAKEKEAQKKAERKDKPEKQSEKPAQKVVETKKFTKTEDKKETADTKEEKTGTIPVPEIVSKKDFPETAAEKPKQTGQTGQTGHTGQTGQRENKPYTKKPDDRNFRQNKPYNKDFQRQPRTDGKPEYKGQQGKPDYKPQPRTDGKPGEKPKFDKSNKGKFERVTIKDTGKPQKKFFSKDNRDPNRKPGDKPRVGPIPIVPLKDAKKVDKSKDKKPKPETEFERKKKKIAKGQKAREFSQKEIDEAIRETFAKIEDDSGASARSIARKKKKKERLEQEKKAAEIQESRKNILSVTEFVSTLELSNIMEVPANEIIKKCLDLGMMVSINQRLEKDLILLLAEEFGFKIEFQSEYEEDMIKDDVDPPEMLKDRPPVVTVMGHVDHGKTSLLDYVRKADVVAGEAGGITQHIGAYKVRLENGKQITFLDTPGHEAFTAMRARGGQAADIVVLVVAADDSVMPQTIEAINHAQAAGVPIVIAINKVDKPEANVERIKSQLADRNILVEEWGGKYQCVEISAKKGLNIQVLLDKILLEAELLELKANPDRTARGVVLESKLDKGRGSVATILVQKGTLKIGDSFVAGVFSGKVRAMFDERDKRVETAGPSTPVQVIGFEGLPQAGDSVIVLESESEVRSIALKRQQLKREQELRQVKHTTLEDITNQIKQGKSVELHIILKTDVDGSAEALADSLHKLSKPGIATVTVIHKAVGAITESDVLLAEASNAVIIGFNVRPNLNARKLAEKSNVEIRLHSIIYAALDEVKLVLEGLLAPDVNEEVTATIEIRQVFKVPKIGNIAGCYVQDGKILRNHKVRLIRDGLEIFNGTISSLKRLKDDVREVESGYECGIGLENFSDLKVGDVIEGYKLIETKRKLESV
ncbi:MAG: translation initiation factor IF-2 [Ignavibacteria bacterium]|nr:translation initiation factor IF-2 [Ignavibacteria bacterium]